MQIEAGFAIFTGMKRSLLFTLPFLGLLLALSSCRSEFAPGAERSMAKDKPCQYLALGDSYTIGTAIGKQNSYATLLADSLRSGLTDSLTYRHIAANGWTTANLLAGMRKAAPDSTQDLVSLLIGVNNQYQGLSPTQYRKEFRQLAQWSIALARGQAERVLVLSIPDWGHTPAGAGERNRVAREIDAFNAINQGLSDSLGLVYLPITALSRQALHDNRLIAKDSLHFSAIMHQLWLEQIYPVAAAKLRPCGSR